LIAALVAIDLLALEHEKMARWHYNNVVPRQAGEELAETGLA